MITLQTITLASDVNHLTCNYRQEVISPCPILKILSSHPVQYHVPFFRAIIAEGVDIEVGYYHQGAAGRVSHDPGFDIDFEWDIDLWMGIPTGYFSGNMQYHWLEQIKVAPRLLSWALQDRQTPFLLMGWFNELIWLLWLLRIFRKAPIIVMSETTPLSFTATQSHVGVSPYCVGFCSVPPQFRI